MVMSINVSLDDPLHFIFWDILTLVTKRLPAKLSAIQKLSDDNKDSLKRAVAAYDGQTVKYNWFISHSSDFRDKLEKPEVTNKQLQDAFIKVFGVKTESEE